MLHIWHWSHSILDTDHAPYLAWIMLYTWHWSYSISGIDHAPYLKLIMLHTWHWSCSIPDIDHDVYLDTDHSPYLALIMLHTWQWSCSIPGIDHAHVYNRHAPQAGQLDPGYAELRPLHPAGAAAASLPEHTNKRVMNTICWPNNWNTKHGEISTQG